MKPHEMIVTAALSAIMSAVGIKALSPEAQEMADTVQLAASVQDWKVSYAGEISGLDYTAGIVAPISTEGIGGIGEAIQAAGIDQNPEAIQEATAAATRWLDAP